MRNLVLDYWHHNLGIIPLSNSHLPHGLHEFLFLHSSPHLQVGLVIGVKVILVVHFSADEVAFSLLEVLLSLFQFVAALFLIVLILLVEILFIWCPSLPFFVAVAFFYIICKVFLIFLTCHSITAREVQMRNLCSRIFHLDIVVPVFFLVIALKQLISAYTLCHLFLLFILTTGNLSI